VTALSERDAAAVGEALAGLERDVAVRLELGPTAVSVALLAAGGGMLDPGAETRAIAEAVCALSDRVTLDVVERDEPGPWPQLTIGDGLVYRGMPLGYELTSLVLAIAEAGRAEPSLDASSRARLAALDGPVELLVYVTPT
jgi:alkyl hydroperoxide reductase subunit AhpF